MIFLRDLIKILSALDPDAVVERGFANPHSYRGFYDQLAFEPAKDVTVGAMLADALSAVGATYTGWKGGEYTMDELTPCWLSWKGTSNYDDKDTQLAMVIVSACTAIPPPTETTTSDRRADA